MSEKGLCSIIVPAYCCAATIQASIASAQNQSYRNIEILVVNDASPDHTCQLVSALADADSRIRLISHEKNQGVAAARNKALEYAQGEYVAFLDSDDVWEPQKLACQIPLLENADLCYSSYEFIDGGGSRLTGRKLVPPTCTLEDLLKENFILCSSVVLKRTLTQNQKFDGSYSHEDYVYWLELLKKGIVAMGVSDILVQYRLTDSNRSGNKIKAAQDRWDVYRRYMGYSRLRSLRYFVIYAIRGFQKYKKVKK